MKVLFLDIDGVMIPSPETYNETYNDSPNIETSFGFFPSFSEESVTALNDIHFFTEIKIVISSDWTVTMINSLSNMISLFRLNRIIPEVIGFTTKIRSSNLDSLEIIRESEISRWVDTHRPESWVAVDDLDLSGLDPNFVHCIDTIKGISDETVKLSILQKLKY